MTTIRRVLLSIILLLLAICAGVVLAWEDFLRTPLVTEAQGVRFKVGQGATFKIVTTDLYNQHIISSPYLFNYLVRYRNVAHALKAGEYLFPKGTTPNHLIDQITTGTGIIYHAFTIVPGTTFHQLRQALNKSDGFDHVTKNMSDGDIMKRLGHAGLNPEGMFYPETYYFVVDSADLTLLRRAFNAMQTKLTVAWEHRAANLPFKNAYEALTAASIIEKEAELKNELPIIAGVLTNRLRHNIILQFDPTVIYGVGTRYDGTIHRSDLRADTPYNTYVHKGLPPTPISLPGKDAMEAVMHPDANNYLYFVARGHTGSHQFSRTLTEHNAAVLAARQDQSGFFNSGLVKQYVMKSFIQTQFNTN